MWAAQNSHHVRAMWHHQQFISIWAGIGDHLIGRHLRLA
jgi:hypothetical protein